MNFEPIYFVNGKFVKKSKALIGVNDLGLIRGYGVFDFMVTYNRKVFLLSKHLSRLEKSAKLVSIPFIWNKSYLVEILDKLIKQNTKLGELQMRVIVTGGTSPDNLLPNGNPSLIISVESRHIFPKHCYLNGVKVITCNSGRIIPEAKTLNYINAVKANIEAKTNNAIEALYILDNYVLEGTTSNIFIVSKNIIYTPKASILPGITRNFVLEICERKYKVVQRKIKLKELMSADEVFITATNKEVMPVTTINDKQIGDGKVGPVTSQIMNDYAVLVGKI